MVNTAEFNFTNLASSTERTLRLLGKNSDNDNLRESIQELLNYSAGKVGESIFYRPYYVAATILSQDLQANLLIEADNVKFQTKDKIIQSFISTQKSLDISLGLIIPLGFRTQDFLNQQSGIPQTVRRVYGSNSSKANFTF